MTFVSLSIERKKNKPQCRNDIHSDYPIIKIVDFSNLSIICRVTEVRLMFRLLQTVLFSHIAVIASLFAYV